MAAWSDHDVTIDGLAIHYYRMGNAEKPPVLLLHGFSDNGLAWVRLATDLAADYDLIMPDAVGHGRSGGPEPGKFRSRAVTDVLALIATLGLDRPALIGHSMGAGTAARTAAEAGDRIRCVVLEDPPWRDGTAPPSRDNPADAAPSSRAPTGSPGWVAWLKEFRTRSPEERVALARTERPHWTEEERALWAEGKARFNLDVLKEMPGPTPPPWRETVRRITCPVLLITADPERGGIVTPQLAREAEQLSRTGRVVQIPDAGHNIRRDRYEPFREAVVAFLAEHP